MREVPNPRPRGAVKLKSTPPGPAIEQGESVFEAQMLEAIRSGRDRKEIRKRRRQGAAFDLFGQVVQGGHSPVSARGGFALCQVLLSGAPGAPAGCRRTSSPPRRPSTASPWCAPGSRGWRPCGGVIRLVAPGLPYRSTVCNRAPVARQLVRLEFLEKKRSVREDPPIQTVSPGTVVAGIPRTDAGAGWGLCAGRSGAPMACARATAGHKPEHLGTSSWMSHHGGVLRMMIPGPSLGLLALGLSSGRAQRFSSRKNFRERRRTGQGNGAPTALKT